MPGQRDTLLTLLGAAVAASAAMASAQTSAPPAFPNDGQPLDLPRVQLEQVVSDLRAYGEPAGTAASAWSRDQQLVIAQAQACLSAQLQRRPPRPAVIFDIDETLLSNWWFIRQQPNLAANKAVRTQSLLAGTSPALAPTLALVGQARRQGVALVLISGRSEAVRQVTHSNLVRAGLGDYARLLLVPAGNTLSPGAFKAAARQALRAQGWTLVANVGDQLSDLQDSSGSMDVPCSAKLPNPYYAISW